MSECVLKPCAYCTLLVALRLSRLLTRVWFYSSQLTATRHLLLSLFSLSFTRTLPPYHGGCGCGGWCWLLDPPSWLCFSISSYFLCFSLTIYYFPSFDGDTDSILLLFEWLTVEQQIDFSSYDHIMTLGAPSFLFSNDLTSSDLTFHPLTWRASLTLSVERCALFT